LDNYKKICPDFDEDHIFVNGKKRIICSYIDLKSRALCDHESYFICKFYFIKKKIEDPWLIDFMEQFGCVIVGKDAF
jgi:hypothetical protein